MLSVQNSKCDVSPIDEESLLVLDCNFPVRFALFFIIILGEHLFVGGVPGLAISLYISQKKALQKMGCDFFRHTFYCNCLLTMFAIVIFCNRLISTGFSTDTLGSHSWAC